MAPSEERLELERSPQQAGSALQAANNRIATLESAAGATTPTAMTTPSASMVDTCVLGKPSNFAGDEASWKSWSFIMLSGVEQAALPNALESFEDVYEC